MKKKKLFIIACAVVGCILAYLYQNGKQQTISQLLLTNIEALADGDERPKKKKCSRAIISGSCYNRETDKWAGIYVDYVEEFEVPDNEMYNCPQDKIQKCPSGTYRKK